MSFQNPLALLLLLPLGIVLMARKKPMRGIIFPAISDLVTISKTLKQRVSALLPLMRISSIFLALISLARPQISNTETIIRTKGVDIVISLDLSTSMLAVDRSSSQHRSRLDIAKDVTRDFITKRTGDRIGLVAFAARPYPIGPLTVDHQWLTETLIRLSPSSTEDGTAIGDGLLAALNRLRSSPAESRTIILLTDGRSNTGATTPQDATAVAHGLGVKIHTVGIGSKGKAEFPVEDPFGGTIWREVNADLDEAALRDIASMTGGRYFRADNADNLRSIFAEIDKLEKRTITEKKHQSTQELFPPIILATFLLLMAEQTLRATWLRGIP